MKNQSIRKLKESGLAALVRINPGKLPDFIVVGAQKAGTSSLFAALTSHPKIYSSLRKEVHYFDLRLESHPLSWYTGHFLPSILSRNGSITGEASPSYMFFPYCAKAIASVCPGARILFVLRDPVERAISHFQHNRRHMPSIETECDAAKAIFSEKERVGPILNNFASASPADCATAARFAYLTRGHYAEQIIRFQTCFDTRNIIVLGTTELDGASGNGTSDRLCDFLGVPRHPLVFERRNSGTENMTISEDLRAQLTNYYAAHNEKLGALLGQIPPWKTEGPAT